jgi:predicted phage baseplate assembly protein
MALPAPNLDDRRFQDLVDDAKRMVQRMCPEWTDHNVSDPGVTLIETFAFMTDQLLYRLNRVPDRLRLKFLDLIGLRMFPPAPAVLDLTFWLSTPAVTPMSIPVGTEAGTIRTEVADSIVFSTREPVPIRPCKLKSLRTKAARDSVGIDRATVLRTPIPFAAFSDPPQVGDLLLVGLDTPVPHCAVRLDMECHVQGLGVNPEHPPLLWEAWTSDGWIECEVEQDDTGGINRDGAVTLHVPAGHRNGVEDGDSAAWLRARVVAAELGQTQYTASPTVVSVTACTVGATGRAINAEIIEQETLGPSEGVAGQSFSLSRQPVLPGVGCMVIEVSSPDGWDEWRPVDDFAASGPDDRHFVLDGRTGEILFGPVVRLADGTTRRHGAIPGKGETVQVRRYAVGGGAAGNVAARTVRTLRSSIPFVSAVDNRRSAHGGVDAETLDEAVDRGPLMLRTRNRAVTAEDYELLARDAVPEAARVRCITAGEADVAAGSVKVLVVPAAAADRGRIVFADLVPPEQLLARLADRLDEVRLIGTHVIVEPPLYRGVTVVARVLARPRTDPARITEDALDALHVFLNPLPGNGPDGRGWPFGRSVRPGDLHGVLQAVRGVEFVEDVRLFTANPVTGERGTEQRRIDLEPNSLVFSFDHQVKVEVTP